MNKIFPLVPDDNFQVKCQTDICCLKFYGQRYSDKI